MQPSGGTRSSNVTSLRIRQNTATQGASSGGGANSS